MPGPGPKQCPPARSPEWQGGQGGPGSPWPQNSVTYEPVLKVVFPLPETLVFQGSCTSTEMPL